MVSGDSILKMDFSSKLESHGMLFLSRHNCKSKAFRKSSMANVSIDSLR